MDDDKGEDQDKNEQTVVDAAEDQGVSTFPPAEETMGVKDDEELEDQAGKTAEEAVNEQGSEQQTTSSDGWWRRGPWQENGWEGWHDTGQRWRQSGKTQRRTCNRCGKSNNHKAVYCGGCANPLADQWE